MPRKTSKRLPKLGRHSSGQARVTLNGKVYYLGTFGSLEAQKAYADLIERWEQNGRRPLEAAKTVVQLRKVGDAIDDYLAYLTAAGRYIKQGKPTSQRSICERALDEFRDSYGSMLLSRLAGEHVVLHRDMLERRPELTRGGINKKVQHIRACMRWLRDRGMLTRDQWLGVVDIATLTRSTCVGRDWKIPKRAVTLEEVEAVAKVVSPQVAAMLRVQGAIGCRPGEVVAMRWHDIGTETIEIEGVPCRIYVVRHAKNEHHGAAPTTYCLPPSVLAILGVPIAPGGHVFPSPITGRAYTVGAYRTATVQGCRRAGIKPFNPHCVRHGFVTRAANQYGVLAAASAANHSSTKTTQGYLHQDTQDGYRCVVGLLESQAG